MSRLALALGWALLLTALLGCALWTRPLVPIDETRYAAVAWEMWSRGDWLVPHLNGAPYHHKPPLLFWLVQLGWATFGVHDWAARLVPALFALTAPVLLARLARALWPAEPAVARWAPWALAGGVYYALFATMLMFDLLMVTWTLLGLLGLARAWRHGGRGGWRLYALGIGLGVLSKGPAILLYLLPAGLLAPWWIGGENRPASWKRWYRELGLALLGGAGLALAWAVPAAVFGGAEYREAIFWGQTAGRMVESFAHQRPWWWYLPLLPLLALPWTLWLPAWRALPQALAGLGAGGRFCAAWFVPGLLAFSAVSGKQVHYLLPLLPALALLVARALARCGDSVGRVTAWLPAVPVIALGLVLALAPLLAESRGWPDWVGGVSPLWGLLLAALGAAWPKLLRRFGAPALAALVAAFGIVLHLGVIRAAAPAFDGAPLGRAIAEVQARGAPVAHAGKYHGEFQFPGRLTAPLTVIPRGGELAWAEANPEGALVLRHRELGAGQRAAALAVQPYRARYAVLWPAAVLRAHPEWLAGEDAGRDDGKDDE